MTDNTLFVLFQRLNRGCYDGTGGPADYVIVNTAVPVTDFDTDSSIGLQQAAQALGGALFNLYGNKHPYTLLPGDIIAMPTGRGWHCGVVDAGLMEVRGNLETSILDCAFPPELQNLKTNSRLRCMWTDEQA